MKKCMFLLGAAVAALASCTNEEVTEVAQSSSVIGFNAFANNTTKADISGTGGNTFTKFYVFGDTKSATGSWEDVFTNAEVLWETNEWNVQKDAYWVTDNAYEFAAYSDGNTSLNGASFAPDTKTLSFINYTAGTNDLVGAFGSVTSAPANQGDVSLTFSHLLSKVQFTFTTSASEDITIKINSVKFNAVRTTDGTYTSTGATWITQGKNATEYNYDVANLEDIAAASAQPFTTAMYVIPQNCSQLEATINLDITGAGLNSTNNDVTASLAFSKGSGDGTDNLWEDGYVYNYIADIDPADIIDGLKRIDFTVEKVNDWTETEDQNMNLQ